MEQIINYLSQNAILAISICLAFGYCIGKIKIRTFSFGPTIGTLVVGFVLSRFVAFEIPGILATIFSLLFCFTIGYEAGPTFFSSLKSNGIKFAVQAVFFSVCAFLSLYLLALSGIVDKDTVIGMAAGALTQTSVLTVAGELGTSASVAYAVTYMTGTLFAILFVSVICPKILGTSAIMAARKKLEKQKAKNGVDDDIRTAPIYPRAYIMEAGSKYIGATIEHLEDDFAHALEVVKITRNGKDTPFSQDTTVEERDVLTVIGSNLNTVVFDDEFAKEVADREYLVFDLVSKDIIVTESENQAAVDTLSEHGIVIQKITSEKGKKLPVDDTVKLAKGMVLHVSGAKASVRKLAQKIGYVKETGTTTDVPVVFGALAIAILFGSLKVAGFGLGDSTCALILGLICGWFQSKKPRHGVFPESARWFLKSVGLNVFISVKALTTGLFEMDAKMLIVFGLGICVTLVPHIITALFSKYVMKMDAADILGGQCGSGTCTAALNSLIDSSGSSVFTASYAVTNAVANIMLTVLGVVLSTML